MKHQKKIIIAMSALLIGTSCMMSACSAKPDKYYTEEEISSCSAYEYTAKGAILAYGGGFDQDDDQRMIIVNKSIALSGVQSPKMLFMATGHFDVIDEVEEFVELYKKAGCSVETLAPSNATTEEIKQKIAEADIIYETGGNLNFLNKTWGEAGVFPLMREAYERGAVLVGVSTGAMCWAQCGYDCSGDEKVVEIITDFPFIGKDNAYEFFDASGIIPFCLGVHFDNIAYRTLGFKAVKLDIPSLCLENGTAVIYRNGKYEFMIDPKTPNRKAYFYYPSKDIKKVDVTTDPTLVNITDAYVRLNGYLPRT